MTFLDRFAFILTVIAAFGSGLIGGVFFVFSDTIMKALGRLPANEGMAAMQQINVVILNPVFLGIFIGTALCSAALAVSGIARLGHPGSGYLIAGAVLFVVGSLLLTMFLNVPLNNALMAADPSSAAGREVWDKYLTDWTFWNHVRTIASLLASIAFILASSSASKP
ncbi:MAG: DUF1772 domain-containing protein [Acidobacteria bacterium]|nr:DUF1772 domain-containing protein [Acidobacteriota bacterium]